MHFVFTAPRYHTNQHFAAKALVDAGHRVTFVVLRRGQSETYAALTPIVLGCSPVFDVWRRLAARLPGIGYSDVGGMPPPTKFARTMRKLRPSAVVVRDPKSAYGQLASLVAKLLGAKLILYTQTPKHQPVSLRKRLLFAAMLRTTGGEWFTPLLGWPAAYPPVNPKLRYLPFVAEAGTSPARKRRFAGDSVHILEIGKFMPRKRHDLFLEAIARIAPHYAVRAVIVGEAINDEHREVLAKAIRRRAELGLESTVDIRTNLPFEEVQRLYASHDLFVLPSEGEPAAVSVLEAMAHSLPVICSDTNGTACYVVSGRSGFVFRSGDVDHLAESITAVIQDRKRLIAMGEAGYEQVRNEHHPCRYVGALVDMGARN